MKIFSMASLTNSDVHFYCDVDMRMNSEEEPITSVVQHLVCSEPHYKLHPEELKC